MIIRLERTPLIEIARYHFNTKKWGHEAALLACLREEKLVASINYPTYLPSLKKIPKEVWEEMDIKDFDILERPFRGRTGDNGEYNISGDDFLEDELQKIEVIARAAVDHDVSLIPEDLKSVVLEELEIQDFKNFTDWISLVQVFHEVSQSLEHDNRKDFPVFVLEEDMDVFLSSYAPAQNDGKKGGASGAPTNLYWRELYGHLISMIVEHKQSRLLDLTGENTWGGLSGKIMNWAENNIELRHNKKLPGTDTLERSIKKLEKTSLK